MVKFKNKLQTFSNNRIIGQKLLEIFYRALITNTMVVNDTIIEGAFISLYWEHLVEILD